MVIIAINTVTLPKIYVCSKTAYFSICAVTQKLKNLYSSVYSIPLRHPPDCTNTLITPLFHDHHLHPTINFITHHQPINHPTPSLSSSPVSHLQYPSHSSHTIITPIILCILPTHSPNIPRHYPHQRLYSIITHTSNSPH